jgi:hypothetical protein
MEMYDPLLGLSADILSDLESVRIMNENRLRQLTRSTEDSDGNVRGFGLTEEHPDVARLAAMVDTLNALEHEATLNLQRTMRRNLLGPWVKAQRGIGEKQAARLLAAIRDPYWNDLHDRPRTVSELWAFCGYHTLPVSQSTSGTQSGCAGGAYNIAARRTKGQKSNWSSEAKMRAYLISESVVKAGGPWRDVYDARKAATESRLHGAPCVRCGPSGKPAQPGSEWSKGHRHADALRILSKEILKGLWTEARRLHGA